MNIYDISEKAGVSIATVSRVLNGNSKVSEKTRQKIMKVIEETGYTPNVFARGLGLNTMNTVGILCADCSDVVLAASLYQTEQRLRQYQYDTLLSCTGYDTDMKAKCTEMLLSKRVDALIYVGSNFVHENNDLNQYIIEAAKKVPVMIINGYLAAPNVYCALCDDTKIMEEITDAFLARKRRILYLCRTLSNSGNRKLQGVLNAFEKYGVRMDEENFMMINESIKNITGALTEKWESGVRWDVVLTADDELGIAAYKFAIQNGLKIPEEMQIAGYNNSTVSICCEPELTTVDNHMTEASISVVDNLMQLFEGKEITSKTVLNPDLISRGTTIDI